MEVFLYAFKKQVWEISSNWLIFQSLLFSIEVVVNFLCSLQTSYPANLLLIYLLIRGDALGINSLNFCLPVHTNKQNHPLCLRPNGKWTTPSIPLSSPFAYSGTQISFPLVFTIYHCHFFLLFFFLFICSLLFLFSLFFY